MNNQKLLIGVIALVVIGLGGYLYYSRSTDESNTSPVSSTLVSSNTNSNPVSLGESQASGMVAFNTSQNEIATLLRSVNQIKLDTAVLRNPAFLALIDTSLTLPEFTITGRANPFARSSMNLVSNPNKEITNDTPQVIKTTQQLKNTSQ